MVAELEPSLFETQVEQARASLTRLEAEVRRADVQLDDAQQKLARAHALNAQQLVPATDLETASVNVRMAQAALQAAQAQVVQARASLHQSEVNLAHTIITAPIDGIVISRNVDVGQTVAASMQAPTLFVIARDLREMQVEASIAEPDIGRIQPGQSVTFRVDAYPTEMFTGIVTQVRLQPVVEQNVVSYITVIAVPNRDLRLKPRHDRECRRGDRACDRRLACAECRIACPPVCRRARRSGTAALRLRANPGHRSHGGRDH